MKTSSKIALLAAGAALSAAAVASAYADNGPRGMMRHGDDGPRYGRQMQEGMGPRGDGPGFAMMFQRADKDNSGTVTFEEFTAASPMALASADANGDGQINADELTDSMMREMMKRRAERMIERLDSDNDGQISMAEVENSQKRMFERIDIDGSGAIEQDELPQGRGMRGDGPRFGDGGGYHHRQGGWGRN